MPTDRGPASMNGAKLGRWLSLLFIAGVIAAAVAFNISKPRVLILHSYSADYPWTRDIDVGIRRIAGKWSSYVVTWHYMDTKKHADQDWQRYAGIVARRAIDHFEPDVLIAVDDPAQKLAASHYVDRPGMNIVFAGINGRAEPYGYHKAGNVTGIFERKPLRAVKEMIQTLEAGKPQPNPAPRILYLMDPSTSMAQDREFVVQYDWAPIRFAGSQVARNYLEWQAIVGSLRERGIDYLVVANYRELSRSAQDAGKPSASEIMRWTEAHSPVPVLGVNVFNVEDGGSLAVGASPFEQGEVAATLAETLIERRLQGGRVPTQTNRYYVVAINQEALRQRGLQLPQIYETFARTTATFIENKP